MKEYEPKQERRKAIAPVGRSVRHEKSPSQRRLIGGAANIDRECTESKEPRLEFKRVGTEMILLSLLPEPFRILGSDSHAYGYRDSGMPDGMCQVDS